MLTSSKYSDLTITCGSDTYKVHKAIVCSQSTFFDNADKFGGKETTENKVDLPEDDPAVIKLMVQYICEGDYDPRMPPDSSMNAAGVWTLGVTKDGAHHYSFPHTCTSECRDKVDYDDDDDEI